MKFVIVLYILLVCSVTAFTQVISTNEAENLSSTTTTIVHRLNLPVRSPNAPNATEFTGKITDLNVEDRENAIIREILAGNVPTFARTLKPIKISETIEGQIYELTFFATSDYLAIGSDEDYLYVPMTPRAAQVIANQLDCLLPTKKMVDLIYDQSAIKLRPQPIPPSDEMTTVPVFRQHTDSVRLQLSEIGTAKRSDAIVAGHKKDIIISGKIYDPNKTSERVVIYGWHKTANVPIQPVYNGHAASYADYSHGVRLISDSSILNGSHVNVAALWQDSTYALLLSSEGVITRPYYSVK